MASSTGRDWLLLPRRRNLCRQEDIAQRRGRIYDAVLASSTLGRLCGQLLSVGFDGTEAPDPLLRRIAASEVGGVMLFRPNIANPAQVTSVRWERPSGAGCGPLPATGPEP